MLDQILDQRIIHFDALTQCDIGIYALPLHIMRIANHSGLCDSIMADQCAFDFSGTHAMTGDIDHVINAAGDPVEAILVAAAAITGKIRAGIGRKIRVDESLMIAVDRSHLSRPTIRDQQIAVGRAFQFVTVRVHQHWLHAKERMTAGARLHFGRARQRNNHGTACLGLPPSVDDRTPRFTYDVEIPFPCFRIDRFANCAQQTDRLARCLVHWLFAFAHQCANSGWRGVEDGNVLLVAHLPEPRSIRIGRHTFKDETCCAICQRSVHDICVPGYPTHICRTPEHVIFLEVKYILVRH